MSITGASRNTGYNSQSSECLAVSEPCFLMSDYSSLGLENIFSLNNFLFWLELSSRGIKKNYWCFTVLALLFEIDIDKNSDHCSGVWDYSFSLFPLWPNKISFYMKKSCVWDKLNFRSRNIFLIKCIFLLITASYFQISRTSPEARSFLYLIAFSQRKLVISGAEGVLTSHPSWGSDRLHPHIT